mmetsp:Transcript_24418/g.96321  ORF Transcript_24418/g.96321 Transcript_24418/m.96321 type:complete len:143 (-) Transcript_24418:2095-2523(-)
MQSGCKSLLLRSRGSLERPDVYTQVRFRHKKQRHVVPGRAPIVSNTAMMELAYHHSKPVVRNTKPKWYDYFPGREPLPKYYISRPKPDWRRFSIDKILEFSKVIPEGMYGKKAHNVRKALTSFTHDSSPNACFFPFCRYLGE